MPPTTKSAAIPILIVSASPKNAAPNKIAIMGTLSWTTAAVEAVSFGNTLYHNEYPSPDVTAPAMIARPMPLGSAAKLLSGSNINNTGKHRTKFAAVAPSGSATPRPARL